ncbi:MAG: VIT1/CCC1 transporter family protein [Gammaproteobacteria bacterium]
MTGRLSIHRYLDPGDALGEVLFGLIMALTFTVGARLIPEAEELDARELVVAALGCNIAWGVIDGVLFVLGALYHRSRRARFYRALKRAGSEAEAMAVVQEEFGLEDEPLAIDPADRARLHQAIHALAANAPSGKVRLHSRDFIAAIVVFFLVAASAVPGIVPFLLLDDADLALRLSNAVLLLLLFLAGYGWAHYTDSTPWRVGLTVAVLGLVMVLVAIALGG